MRDLETENLNIRRFKLSDVEDVHKNLATEKQLEECLGYHVHSNLEETRMMVSSYIKEYDMSALVWAIEEKSSNKVIGYINALEVSMLNKRCDIKFGIAFNWVEKELMEEALICVLDYLFNVRKFNIVTSYFFDGYPIVAKIKRKILEKVGMQQDAVLRNRQINEKSGVAENKVVYSILKEEFKII